MTTATKIEQTTHTAGIIEDAGNAISRLSKRIFNGLVALGEISDSARRARVFAAMNALSDEQLAERGLKRSDLTTHCFGPKAYL
ncbi:MAG: hypothetical protein AAFV19_01245 [Pseudomonadota bacterium]